MRYVERNLRFHAVISIEISRHLTRCIHQRGTIEEESSSRFAFTILGNSCLLFEPRYGYICLHQALRLCT